MTPKSPPSVEEVRDRVQRIPLKHGLVALVSEFPIDLKTATIKEHAPLGEGPLRAATRRSA